MSAARVGALVASLVASSIAEADVVSREVVARVPRPGIVAASDEIVVVRFADDRAVASNEVVFIRRAETSTVVSREVVFSIGAPARTVTSRELVWFVSSGDGPHVSREASLRLAPAFAGGAGFVVEPIVGVPSGRGEWSSLAIGEAFVVAAARAVDGGRGAVFEHDAAGDSLVTIASLDSDTASPVDVESTAGGEVYVAVADDDTGAILVVDGAALRVHYEGDAVSRPSGLEVFVDEANETILVGANDGDPSLFAISDDGSGSSWTIDGLDVTAVTSVSPPTARGVSASWIAGTGDGDIYDVDPTGVATRRASLGSRVQSLAVPPAGAFVGDVVALTADGAVVGVDDAGAVTTLAEHVLVQRVPGDYVRNDVAFAADGSALYVTDALRGVVHAIRRGGPLPTPDADGALRAIPNPFVPATSIRVVLESPDTVTLRIFDVAGRLVRTLLRSEAAAPGTHDIPWDGRDRLGRPVGAGVYRALAIFGDRPNARLSIVRVGN